MNLERTKNRLQKTRGLLSCYKGVLTGHWIRRSLAHTNKNHWRKQTTILRRQTSEIRLQILDTEQHQVSTKAQIESLNSKLLVAQSELVLCDLQNKLLEVTGKVQKDELADLKTANNKLIGQQKELEELINEISNSDKIGNRTLESFRGLFTNQASNDFRGYCEENVKFLNAKQTSFFETLKNSSLLLEDVSKVCQASLINVAEQVLQKPKENGFLTNNSRITNGALSLGSVAEQRPKAKFSQIKKLLRKLKHKYRKSIVQLNRKMAVKPTGRQIPQQHLLNYKINILEDIVSKQRKDLMRISLENADLKQKLLSAST